jgi:aerobic-type carbon monoxide dehydrogenase small subunit (CoxS/CutS family)
MTTYRLQVNGKVHTVDQDADTPLLYVLRNDLELNGAKFGCGLGQCGSCTVLLKAWAMPPPRACYNKPSSTSRPRSAVTASPAC